MINCKYVYLFILYACLSNKELIFIWYSNSVYRDINIYEVLYIYI